MGAAGSPGKERQYSDSSPTKGNSHVTQIAQIGTYRAAARALLLRRLRGRPVRYLHERRYPTNRPAARPEGNQVPDGIGKRLSRGGGREPEFPGSARQPVLRFSSVGRGSR